MKRPTHSLHLLLPFGLLAVFALSAVLAVLLSASAFRQVSHRSDRLTFGTSVTYIREKVRQSDTAGAIRVDRLGDCPALVITREERAVYDTYIYCYDGSLRELTIRREVAPEPSMGRALAPMASLELEREGSLLKILCTDGEGRTLEAAVALRSGEVAP